MSTSSLSKYAASGLLGLHFTPEELFIGVGHRQGRTYHVGNLGCVDIRPHMLEGGEFNFGTLVPAIQSALVEYKIRTRRAVFSFPVKFPWIRVLEVPAVPDRELARIVRLEVERLYLDSTVDKLIDFYPLESHKEAGPGGTIKVLSVAIPRNAVAPYVDLLHQARLETVGVDLAEVSVLKLAAMQGINFADGITLVLNFNMQSTDLLLLENDTLQLVRKVGQGKQQLREVFARGLPSDNLAREDLGKLECRLPSEFVRLANDYVSSLLGEIRRSIEFYLTELKRAEGNVSKVVVAGSGYWPVNLPEILGQQLHLPLIDLSFDRLPNVVCDTAFGPSFPALGVYAPVVGSVLAGVA